MISKMLSVFCVASLAVTPIASAESLDAIKAQLQSESYETAVENNDVLFAKYCIGNVDQADIPAPNYSEALVSQAAKILAKTKIDADNRLREMAQDQFQNNLTYIQESLVGLIEGTANPVIEAQAQKVLKAVSVPGITNLDQATLDDFAVISSEILTQTKKIMPSLAQKLAAEMGSIDYVAARKATVELEKLLKKELRTVDLKKLQALLQPIKKALEANVTGYDRPAIAAAATKIQAAFAALPENEELEYGVNSVNTLLAAVNDPSQDIGWMISDLKYYVETLLAGQDQVAQYTALLDAESLKSGANGLLAAVIALNEAFTNNPENVNYLAPDLVYSLESTFEGNSGAFGSTLNEVNAINAAIVAYKAEAANFQSAGILSGLADALNYFAQGTAEANDNAVNTAVGIQYTLNQMLPGLSAKAQSAYSVFSMELAKQNSQSVITTANDILAKVTAAKELDQDLAYEIQNLAYNFENGLDVSPATLQLVKQYQMINQDLTSWTAVNSSLGSSATKADSGHFYFYGGVRRMYRLSDEIPQVAKAAGANREAHWFLTQLCGEFRDRATMIEAKLNWIQNLYTLPLADDLVKDPSSLAGAENVWSRVSALAYRPYISFTSQLWEARRESQERYITVGEYDNVDNPVVGTTVCETKYIFANYVAAGKDFDSIEKFDKGYAQYKAGCPQADQDDYFDFRGDSNFKHYSPESNGMIWYATSIASACKSMGQAKGTSAAYADQDCENYFKRPYFYRYNAARAGLAAWLFRDDQYKSTFSSQGSMVAIYPHREPELAPFSFGFDQTTTEGQLFAYDPNWLSVPGAWNSTDIGFNALTGLGTSQVNAQDAYERIRDAVDRHTDWYSSGYNDAAGGTKDQAYSPFVASSYEMSASDGFTSCGVTVQCPPDGLKRWMFVFRVKKQNWYNPARILNNEPINFDTMWFDETSFGISGLADSEKAWDRLGTPQEEELDSILYLINVEDYGGEEGGH